jgi:tetratricopeptide (TPR) repeat protein
MSVLGRVAAAKQQAQVERSLGRYEQAADVLQRAIADLQSAIETSQPEERNKAAAELADCLGILGGLYKRQHDLAAAARAYDAGFQYESDPRFNVGSSYNALNRLIVRILMRPDAPAGGSAPNHEDIPLRLRELRSILEASVHGARQNDYWAAGDLALVCALLRDDSGIEAAADHFASLAPPAYAYAAYRETLEQLADAAPDHRPALDHLKQRLITLGQ